MMSVFLEAAHMQAETQNQPITAPGIAAIVNQSNQSPLSAVVSGLEPAASQISRIACSKAAPSKRFVRLCRRGRWGDHHCFAKEQARENAD
jgi:hypothetical protein